MMDYENAADIMQALKAGTQAAVARRIKEGELIPAADLANRLDVEVQELDLATREGKFFTIESHEGLSYYPAFFAEPGLDKRVLSDASRILAALPGESAYFFFTSKSTFLRGRTPLEALAAGRCADVLTAAKGFLV